MAVWIEVATQAWGQLVRPGTNQPLANSVPSINTTVRATASDTGTVIAPADWKSDKDGLLPGFVAEGTWLFIEPDGQSRQVEAISGGVGPRTTSLESDGGPAKINRLPINVKNAPYNAVGDGVADDTAAINAAKAALGVNGGTIFFPAGTYKFTAELNFDDTRTITLRGVGGISAGGTPASMLLFTGTGAGRAISARSTFGFTIEDLSVRYNSTSFTGTLIDFGHSAAALDTSYAELSRCILGSHTLTIRTATTVSFDKAISSRARGCTFSGHAVAVKGKALTGGYSNVISFYGCTFLFGETVHAKNAGRSWGFFGCTFQQLYTGGVSAGAGAYSTDFTSVDVSFYGCGFDDANATGNWISFSGSGLVVSGCYFNNGAKGVLINGGSNFGIVVQGNVFSGMATAVDLGTGQSRCQVVGNDYQTVTTWIAAGDNPSASVLDASPGGAVAHLNLLNSVRTTTLQVTGSAVPAGGAGVEATYNVGTGIGNVYTYDRGTSAWKPTAIGGLSVSVEASGVQRILVNGTGIGFFAATPVAKPTGVAVTAAGIHAALVSLGLIAA